MKQIRGFQKRIHVFLSELRYYSPKQVEYRGLCGSDTTWIRLTPRYATISLPNLKLNTHSNLYNFKHEQTNIDFESKIFRVEFYNFSVNYKINHQLLASIYLDEYFNSQSFQIKAKEPKKMKKQTNLLLILMFLPIANEEKENRNKKKNVKKVSAPWWVPW